MLFGLDSHLVDEVGSAADLVDDEKGVTDIEADVPAEVRVKLDVAHGALPHSVEVDADQAALAVYDRTAGVASGSVVSGDEADRYGAVAAPAAIIASCHYVAESLRYIVVEYLRIVLLHDAVYGRERQIIHSVCRRIALDVAVGYT